MKLFEQDATGTPGAHNTGVNVAAGAYWNTYSKTSAERFWDNNSVYGSIWRL
jgi:hypothetical protein